MEEGMIDIVIHIDPVKREVSAEMPNNPPLVVWALEVLKNKLLNMPEPKILVSPETTLRVVDDSKTNNNP